MTESFDLSTAMQEVVTSLVTLGALVGALLGGGLADRLGRTRTVVIAGVLFAAGAIGEAATQSTGVLTVSRFVVGFGVGIASVAAPLYAAEMFPDRRAVGSSRATSWRSRSESCSLIVDAVLSDDGRWRLMFGLSNVPGVVMVLN
jgi:MFS family permease